MGKSDENGKGALNGRKLAKMGKSGENGKGALNGRKLAKMAKMSKIDEIDRKWQNRRNRGNNKI